METGPGEHVIFEGHPSWRSILGFYFKGLLVAALAGGVAALASRISEGEFKAGWAVATAAVVFALVVVVGFLKRIATTYGISSQRLHIRKGIVARRIQQTRLDRVQNVNTTQSVLERLLQVGTVDWDTAGTDDSDFTFRGVAQPEKVMRAVEEAQREYAADATGLGSAPQAPEPPQPPAGGAA
jgi:uncharacterized membrane protein YdbT with pleckstrin-like domain